MTNPIISKTWFRLAISNLVLIALYGTLMRYKIAFNFPFLEQKNLLHAHSHFAFSGWISHFLYSGLAVLAASHIPVAKQKSLRTLVVINLVSAFGMLLAFTVQGYGAVSISFSTLSIVVAFAYALIFIRSTKYFPTTHPSKPWAIMALLLNLVSAAGPFSLAYMMATKNIDHHIYLGSVYYYLHFQYSGWFFFGSMALVVAQLPASFPSLKRYFPFFAATVIPTFFLSVLWARLPAWVYILTVIATLLQLFAWLVMAIKVAAAFRQQGTAAFSRPAHLFFIAAAVALTIKFLLQAVSVIPSLSQLVFGIRPIVIAYLHLVLLGVYSLFIIGYLFMQGWLRPTKAAVGASLAFLAGVVLNEGLLGLQGFAAFSYLPVPFINELLLGAALLLLGSSVFLFASQAGKDPVRN